MTRLRYIVQDFVEVDNNVTRHIEKELMRDDWTAMILHYLGLDHIGHKAGPKRCGPDSKRIRGCPSFSDVSQVLI
jgi:predicted AlkP superfamily pyrophosphatase or phosphodiesterase